MFFLYIYFLDINYVLHTNTVHTYIHNVFKLRGGGIIIWRYNFYFILYVYIHVHTVLCIRTVQYNKYGYHTCYICIIYIYVHPLQEHV